MNLQRTIDTHERRNRQRINRQPSAILAIGLPWVTIALGSIIATVILIATAPLIPPVGFMLFVAWRQLRPGLLAVWAGLPLGLFDDLYSGQPLGSGVLLWSLTAIALDYVEVRLPWRNFGTDWLVASGLIAAYIVIGLAIANAGGGSTSIFVILPQIGISILAFPVIARIAALFDRMRLIPFVEIE